MSRPLFVQGLCRKGQRAPLINAAMIAKLVPRDGADNNGYECFDAQGERLGAISTYDAGSLLLSSRNVVPDTTGAWVIEFFDDGAGNVGTNRIKIIAWNLSDGDYPEPITADEEDRRVYDAQNPWCIEVGNSWRFPFECSFASLSEASAYAAAKLAAGRTTSDDSESKGGAN